MKTLLRWLSNILHFLEFAGFYLFEIVISNFRVAWDVLYPTNRMKPAIIKVNVAGLTDRQLLAMANLVTMTPGTLSLEVDRKDKVLLVHSMYVEDEELAARELEENFTKRIRRVF